VSISGRGPTGPKNSYPKFGNSKKGVGWRELNRGEARRGVKNADKRRDKKPGGGGGKCGGTSRWFKKKKKRVVGDEPAGRKKTWGETASEQEGITKGGTLLGRGGTWVGPTVPKQF